jgi:hypothetical protein
VTAWSEDEEDGQVSAEAVEDSPTNFKALRARYDEQQLHRGFLERENAILRSEVDLNTPLGEYFYKNYTGEWSPAAVRAKATELGIPFRGQGSTG